MRIAKVKQKVSGCFRSEDYAHAYCRISSYLQTLANQGYNPLIAIQMALAGNIDRGGGSVTHKFLNLTALDLSGRERLVAAGAGTLAENGLIIGEEFRAGNAALAAGNLEFIQYCEQQLPVGKRIVAVRADRAAYQEEIFNACEEKQQQRFAVLARTWMRR